MSKPITTYDELLIKKKNLEELLVAQKELIRLDLEELNKDVTPLLNTVSSFSEFVTRDKRAWFLGMGANALIDMLVKDVLLSKSNWIAKWIVPFFIKNYSSHFIADHQDEWIQKISQWLSSSSNGNGKEHLQSETEKEEEEE